MCSDTMKYAFAALLVSVLLSSCASRRAVMAVDEGTGAGLEIVRDICDAPEPAGEKVRIDDGKGDSGIMNAVRDELTGEMVATDVIEASRVVARFRHAAERNGRLNIEFDIIVPSEIIDSRWKLGFYPAMDVLGETVLLDPVFVTGNGYRDSQMRGYRRYRAFVDSIIADSTVFIRKNVLEMFLRRYFPETYKMKTDSSFVSEMNAENMFGVSVREAVDHYRRHGSWKRNERKKSEAEERFRKFVHDPIRTDGVRLDTVMSGSDGDLVYRYVQDVVFRPGMRKIEVAMDGKLFEDGRVIRELAAPEEIVFYVSSLSTLADMSVCRDSSYAAGVEAIIYTDYKTALKILRPYNDYNTALALVLSGYDDAALECLVNLEEHSARSQYLAAMLYSRKGMHDRAKELFDRSVEMDRALRYRANLDPEMYEIIKHQ